MDASYSGFSAASEWEPPGNVQKFIKAASQVGKRILAQPSVLLIHHFDCDGLTSGGIATRALQEKGIPFRAVCVKKMDPSVVEMARSAPEALVLFTDLATGFLAALNEVSGPQKPIAILDHHPPEDVRLSPHVWMANPHTFGLDGGIDACAASTAFFAFYPHLSAPAQKCIAQTALVGCVGDVQDRNGMVGANAVLLHTAKQWGVVSVSQDLRMFGRVSRSLTQFLSYNSEPFLPGLSGSEKACALFLYKHGLPLVREDENGRRYLHYHDLAESQRVILRGALLSYGTAKGVPAEALHPMLGPVYSFPGFPSDSELSDAYEYSTLLNACGRHGSPQIGVALASGDDSAYEAARNLLFVHRKAISKGIAYARRHTEDFGDFYFLDARNTIEDAVIGTVAGSIFGSGALSRDKPVLAFSIDERGWVKVSGRGTKELVEGGLHLGHLMRSCAALVHGYGGGHNVAAGASFENTPGNVREFLLAAQRVLREQRLARHTPSEPVGDSSVQAA